MNIETLMTALASHLREVLNSSVTGVTVALVVSVVTSLALLVRQRLEWNRAAFESRINISLNTIVDGVLRIRTVYEGDVKDIILSPYARRLLKKAVKKTTLDNPFLRFENKQDAWMFYNGIVNAISSLYAAEILSAAIHGTGADEEEFLVPATWERDAEAHIQKIRVPMVQTHTLEMITHHRGSIKPEFPEQAARIDSLARVHMRVVSDTWPVYQIVKLPRK